jgi:hypothetical protein
LGSRIISDIQDIFAEFRRKKFSLLWRGNEHGFNASVFHSQCNGHPNTLTVILDTKGNIFGGFTPLKWDTPEWNGMGCWDARSTMKGDGSLKSFIFSLKNPYHTRPQRFPLRPLERDRAIDCRSDTGPDFRDFTIHEDCTSGETANTCSWHSTYANDTEFGLGYETSFFTRSRGFTVKEIEVFEVIDDPDQPEEKQEIPVGPFSDSRIISVFLEVFAEFQGKRFVRLWQGTWDGFERSQFDNHCSNHENTLTVILDKEGNIFGGYNPVKWNNPNSSGWAPAIGTEKSFIFTLKNPHNIPMRKFPVKYEKSHKAIRCSNQEHIAFGKDLVFDGPSLITGVGFSVLGRHYVNDSGVKGDEVLTGSKDFEIKEIEVFAIRDAAPPRRRLSPLRMKLPGFLDSQIISDFPEIFGDFREKWFSLLWRGSRDGFNGYEFHWRCDGYSNTLIVILDTKGNIFGGFTPVEWESRVWNGKSTDEDSCLKADDSLTSFLFSLKNPYNVPAKRFPLISEKKHRAINCHAEKGPDFCDITVYSDCNVNEKSVTRDFGSTYVNDSGLGPMFFTGSENFMIKEIEVFEITNVCLYIDLSGISLDSQILSECPEIFAEFRKKTFSLLWRGSRDGFSVSEFRRRCDGHRNNLTVIMDLDGNIFGGFTPLPWVTSSWGSKIMIPDSTDKSFLFTVKNPHNIPAIRFPVFSFKKAINFRPGHGPNFGKDLDVWEDSNGTLQGSSNIGRRYKNTIEWPGDQLLTGAKDFKVKKIEFFEISD